MCRLHFNERTRLLCSVVWASLPCNVPYLLCFPPVLLNTHTYTHSYQLSHCHDIGVKSSAHSAITPPSLPPTITSKARMKRARNERVTVVRTLELGLQAASPLLLPSITPHMLAPAAWVQSFCRVNPVVTCVRACARLCVCVCMVAVLLHGSSCRHLRTYVHAHVCVCVCMCVCACVCMYGCSPSAEFTLSSPAYVRACAHLCVCVRACVCMHGCSPSAGFILSSPAYVRACARLCVCVCVHLCMYVWVQSFCRVHPVVTCVRTCMRTFVCVCVRVCVCIGAVHLQGSPCRHLRTYVHAQVCVSACVRVCVCMGAVLLQGPSCRHLMCMCMQLFVCVCACVRVCMCL